MVQELGETLAKDLKERHLKEDPGKTGKFVKW